MKKTCIGKKIMVLLMMVIMLLSTSGADVQAAVGDLSNVSTGLTGNIDTNDTISLPIKILDYEADGMLFEYAESKDVLNAGDFGSKHYVEVDESDDIGNAWSDVTVTTASNSYVTYVKLNWAGNTNGNWVGGNAGIYVTPFGNSFSMDDIRYVVVVYRSNVTEDEFYFGINRNINGAAGDTGNYTGPMSFKNTGDDGEGSTINWTYAVYDLKTGSLGSNWSVYSAAPSGLYMGLPIDASGEYIELAHIAFFSNKDMATKFGEYALTDGSDRGDNRGFGLLRNSRTQSGGENYAGIIDKTKSVKQLNTYGDTSSIDFSSITTLGYSLLGTFKDNGIANVGLLQSSLSSEGYPVYKEEVVTYLADLLKYSLEIPERTSDGWKNYRYIQGTASSVYGGTDLATALRTRINGTMGSYEAASSKDLVGTWSECQGNIVSYYDAAYFLLNSIFVDGSYNEPQDDYDYLVLSAGTDSDTGDKVYVFDGGFTTSSTPASASMAIDYNTDSNTIQNTSAAGKTHFVYEGSSTTTLNPFLPVTDKNNFSGQTRSVYYQDDAILSTGTTKDTYVNRNFNYALYSSGEFVYHADDELFFDFEGDDDVYLFINGELVMDIGSAHSIDGVRFNLNDYVNAAKAGTLGSAERNSKLALEEGNTYSFKFYYMERHGYGSNMRISTNIHVTDPGMTTAKTAYQGGQQLDFGSIVDKDKVVEYGFAMTNNGQENLYNLTFTDNDIGVTIDPANGLTVTGNRVYDVNGETLEASDLKAIVSHPDYDDITVNFADNNALKAFMTSLASDAVVDNGGGLWVNSTVQIRGIGYKLSEEQVKAGVFDNTVFSTATNKTVSKKLQGQATMRVFVPADPMYYEWAGHDLEITQKELIEDVLSAAFQPDNILAGKVPNLTTSNVNKIELTTRTGNAAINDNVRIDDNNVTITYTSTGSHVFYVKVTYNSSKSTVIVPVLVNVTDVQDSIYVLDYGLTADLTENGELFKNDTLTVPGRSTTSQLLAVGSETPSYNPNNISFTKADENTVEGKDGDFTLDEQELKYKPDDFMDELDTIYTAVLVRESDYTGDVKLGDVNINKEVQMYKRVTTLPATVVYYEDDFPAIKYAADENGTSTNSNVFKQLGEGSETLTQSADQEQNYGQDEAYADSSNAEKSGESLTAIQIKESGRVAYFEFKGTGFELISRTNASNSATITIKVCALNDDGTVGEVIKNIPVITEYDNGANGGAEAIYQVPVVRVDDLELGKYRVIISGIPARDYDNLDSEGNPTIRDTYLYVDGLRIYQPLGAENENYMDEENGASFAEMRDLIVNGKIAVAEYNGNLMTVSTGTVTWTENRNGVDSEGIKYEGNQVDSVNDYLTLGPNNEVYMNGTVKDEAVVFYVKETETGVHNLQIAVHGVDEGLFTGVSSIGINASVYYGTKYGDNAFGWTALVTATSGTEQYYTIDYTKCPYVEGKGYQVALKVNSGMASYTSLKYNGLELVDMDGDAATLYYENGVLKDSSTNMEVAAASYPVFYSLRSQMETEVSAVSNAVEEETIEDGSKETTEEKTGEVIEDGTIEDTEEDKTEEDTSSKDNDRKNKSSRDKNDTGKKENKKEHSGLSENIGVLKDSVIKMIGNMFKNIFH